MATFKPVLNYKFEKPDERDHKFSAVVNIEGMKLPEKFDLRKDCPPVRDQKDIGSCTAFATTSALEFCQNKEGVSKYPNSPLFLYYTSRILEGTDPSDDSGCVIRDVCKSVAKSGVCAEPFWPYDTTKYAEKPPQIAYDEAAKHKTVRYLKVSQILYNLKAALYSGFPIVFGIMVYESMMSEEVAKTGKIPMPNLHREQCVGGHAIILIGFDDKTKQFIGQNSWSENWGDKGYFYIPYEYVTNRNLASDFWTFKYFN